MSFKRATTTNTYVGDRVQVTDSHGTRTGTFESFQKDFDGRSLRWGAFFINDTTGQLDMGWLHETKVETPT